MGNNIPENSRLNDWPNQESFKQGVNENFEKEAGYLALRFGDLSKSGQRKLCNLLKSQSPLWTVRKGKEGGGLTKTEIYNSLRVANPIVFSNYNKGFCRGQLPVKIAKEISQVAYYICRRRPTEETVEKIHKLVSTEGIFPYQLRNYHETSRHNEEARIRIREMQGRTITEERDTIIRNEEDIRDNANAESDIEHVHNVLSNILELDVDIDEENNETDDWL